MAPETDGAHGPCGTESNPVRTGFLSESVAKAPRAGIGRERKRGISTILLRRPGSIRAFATDSDNLRRREPLGEGGHGSDGDHDGRIDDLTGPREGHSARKDTLRSRPGGAGRP